MAAPKVFIQRVVVFFNKNGLPRYGKDWLVVFQQGAKHWADLPRLNSFRFEHTGKKMVKNQLELK